MSIRKENIRTPDSSGSRILALGVSSLAGFTAASVKYYVYLLTGSASVLADIFVTIIGGVFTLYALARFLFFASPSDNYEANKGERFDYISGGVGGPLIVILSVSILWIGMGQIFTPKEFVKLREGLLILLIVGGAHALTGIGLIFWGDRSRSHRIISEGKHVISIIYTSAAVFVGLVIIHITRLSWLDGVLACIIGLRILTSGLQLLLLPFRGFRDASEPDFLNEVCRFFNEYRKAIWVDIHNLKAGYAQKKINIVFHLILPRDMTLETANEEPSEIRRLMTETFGKNVKVLVHIEPCIETDCPYCFREACAMRNREKPKKEQRWTLATLTSDGGPGARLKTKDYAAPASLMSKAISVADYNPRLLEWLFEILSVKGLDHDLILKKMEVEDIENRERAMIQELLNQQPPALKKMLSMMMVFQLPVPKTAIMDICYHINHTEDYMERAASLGLLETSRRQSVRVYRVAEVVKPFLDEQRVKDRRDMATSAVLSLYHLWWDHSDTATEKQGLEILRLALEAEERRIAIEVSNRISGEWISKGGYREAMDMCVKTMKIVGEDYRLLRNLAQSQNAVGRVNEALNHYQLALRHCPDEANWDKASILHNMAVIYTKQGQSTKALTLFEHSLEIKQTIGNEKGKASSLSWIALIYSNQGKSQESLKLHKQALEIQEKHEDMAGKAATLNQMAGILINEGKYAETVPLLRESLEIIQSHRIQTDITTILNRLAGVYVSQGQFKDALSLYQQLREIKRRAGDIKGEAATVALMSKLSVTMLQHLKTPDIKKVRKFMAKVN